MYPNCASSVGSSNLDYLIIKSELSREHSNMNETVKSTLVLKQHRFTKSSVKYSGEAKQLCSLHFYYRCPTQPLKLTLNVIQLIQKRLQAPQFMNV